MEVLGYFDGDRGGRVDRAVADRLGAIPAGAHPQGRQRRRPVAAADELEVTLSGLNSKFGAKNFNQNCRAAGTHSLGGGGTLTNATIQDDTAVAWPDLATPGPRTAAWSTTPSSGWPTPRARNIDLEASLQPHEDWDVQPAPATRTPRATPRAQPFVEFAAPATFDYDLRGGTPKVTSTDIDPTDAAAMAFDSGRCTGSPATTRRATPIRRQEDGPVRPADRRPVQRTKFTDHDRETETSRRRRSARSSCRCLGTPAGPAAGVCTPASFAGGLTPGNFLNDIAVGGTLRRYWQVDRKRGLEEIYFGMPESARARIPLSLDSGDLLRWREDLRRLSDGRVRGRRLARQRGPPRGRNQAELQGLRQGPDVAPGDDPSPMRSPTPLARSSASRSSARTPTCCPARTSAFDLKDDLVLRFAAARTMARPDFTDVAPRVTLNPGALTGSRRQPQHRPLSGEPVRRVGGMVSPRRDDRGRGCAVLQGHQVVHHRPCP